VRRRSTEAIPSFNHHLDNGRIEVNNSAFQISRFSSQNKFHSLCEEIGHLLLFSRRFGDVLCYFSEGQGEEVKAPTPQISPDATSDSSCELPAPWFVYLINDLAVKV